MEEGTDITDCFKESSQCESIPSDLGECNVFWRLE